MKRPYQRPELERLEIAVEAGFNISQPDGGEIMSATTIYDTWGETREEDTHY